MYSVIRWAEPAQTLKFWLLVALTISRIRLNWIIWRKRNKKPVIIWRKPEFYVFRSVAQTDNILVSGQGDDGLGIQIGSGEGRDDVDDHGDLALIGHLIVHVSIDF